MCQKKVGKQNVVGGKVWSGDEQVEQFSRKSVVTGGPSLSKGCSSSREGKMKGP